MYLMKSEDPIITDSECSRERTNYSQICLL